MTMSMQEDRRWARSQWDRNGSGLPLALEMILEQHTGVGDGSRPALSLAPQKRRLIFAERRQAARLEKHDSFAARRELIQQSCRRFIPPPGGAQAAPSDRLDHRIPRRRQRD